MNNISAPPPAATVQFPAAANYDQSKAQRWRFFVLAFLFGISANLCQVAFLRFYLGTLYGTELHVGLFLGVWLSGLAIGNVLGGRFPATPPQLTAMFFFCPLLGLCSIWAGGFLFPPLQGSFLPMGPCVLLLLGMLWPVSVPVGWLIPSLVADQGEELGGFFAWEALGSFVGGILFSLVLSGSASPIQTLLLTPLLSLTAGVLLRRQLRYYFLPLLLWPVLVFLFGSTCHHYLEQLYWQRFHPGYALLQSGETPYQHFQVSTYAEQSSLFVNGTLAVSWPDPYSAEARIHAFLSALPTPGSLLFLGAPAPDELREAGKYPGIQITVVELDTELLTLLASATGTLPDVCWVSEDPRAFLRRSTGAGYTGIFVAGSDAVTLLGNRLLTVEGLHSMRQALCAGGAVCLSIPGTENYLGPEMEQVLLTTWRTVNHVFPHVFGVPGDPIRFWCGVDPGIPATSPVVLAERLRAREIPTVSFRPESFRHLLSPFRLQELRSWTSRSTTVPLNRDQYPASFQRQLLLWDIYSDSGWGWILRGFQNLLLPQTIPILLIFFLILGIISWAGGPLWRVGVVASAGVAVSGGAGLLTEIILLLQYQNAHGAAFQMAAFFFGVYMVGLASGAWVGEHTVLRRYLTLGWIKLIQASSIVACIFLSRQTLVHDAPLLGCMVCFVAFLDGIELPAVHHMLTRLGVSKSTAAGLLLGADSFGALLVGLLSGPWFLPVLGFEASLLLLLAAFIAHGLLYRLLI